MALFLDIAVSIEFWRRIYPVDHTPKLAHDEVPSDCACTAKDVETYLPTWVTADLLAPVGGKVHVLVFDPTLRRDSKTHVTHTWTAPIPKGAFHKLNADVYIASPEFIFLVSATILSEYALVAFGYELCGLYSFDSSKERGMRQRLAPLTTVERLGRFIDGAKGCPGRRRAQQALRHVIERSASPMETFDAMALFGTYRLGGYGLERPILNTEVPLSDRAARIAKRAKCRPDMCLLRVMLDIEHNGINDHTGERAQASDRARTNALKEMGFDVVELTEDQVKDLYAFEYIALRIARILGKRIDKTKLGAIPERLALREEVFAWNRSGGRLR